jgi:glutamate-1-semialdehyde 2,1-aminomutase
VYERLEVLAARLADGLSRAAADAERPIRVQRVGSMLTPFFTDSAVRDETSAKRCDTSAYARFLHELLDRGVYAPPSQFESWFVSLAHTEADVDHAIAAAKEALPL